MFKLPMRSAFIAVIIITFASIVLQLLNHQFEPVSAEHFNDDENGGHSKELLAQQQQQQQPENNEIINGVEVNGKPRLSNSRFINAVKRVKLLLNWNSYQVSSRKIWPSSWTKL